MHKRRPQTSCFRAKDSGCRKAERQIKGMPNQKHRPTSATAVCTAKRDNIIDCFCRALPNGVHSVPAVGRWSGPSYGGPARKPSSPPSCRPAPSGFGRRHSVWRALRPVLPHFAVARTLGKIARFARYFAQWPGGYRPCWACCSQSSRLRPTGGLMLCRRELTLANTTS